MAKNKKTGKEYSDPILDEKIPSARITKEFLSAMPTLSSAAIRLYLYFMKWINYEYKGCIVEASYTTMQNESGIKDRSTLSDAILELAENGWIADIAQRFNAPNVYKINVTAKVNKELVASMLNKRQQMKVVKKDSSSWKNPTNGKFENGSKKNPTNSSWKNQTNGSWKNQTNGSKKNPTLSNTNTNILTNTLTNTTSLILDFGLDNNLQENNSPTPSKLTGKKGINSAISKRHGELLKSDVEYIELKSRLENATGEEKYSIFDKCSERGKYLKQIAINQLQQEGLL